jgi:uncharacterized protein (DUF983 family)
MIRCKEDAISRGYIEFHCPRCGSADVAYMKMPDYCYKCGKNYDVDLQEMAISLKARLEYYTKK